MSKETLPEILKKSLNKLCDLRGTFVLEGFLFTFGAFWTRLIDGGCTL